VRRRLTLTACAVAAAAETYRRGYCWPVLLTVYSLLGRRRPTSVDELEDDVLA